MPKIDAKGDTVTTIRINASSLKTLKIRAVHEGVTLRELMKRILENAAK